MKYIIATLGCKVNQYETQAMETLLNEHGHECASVGDKVDAVIVNTCAVTAESGRKSRQAVRRLAENNPDAVIAVCGCYSQLSPNEAEKLGARVIFGSNDRKALVEAIEKAVSTGEGTRKIDEPFKRREFEKLPAGAVSGRTRAMLKIQDGCVNFCTYCIIPYTRGRLRSLPVADAREAAAKIAAQGYREIILTGIEVASYGRDLPGKESLADLICACAEESGNMRIRLGSLEPTVITDEFCRRLAETGKLCRHFHLSLQSGCDRTLRNMNRKYGTDEFFACIERLKKYFPGCALTADLIVGFPGETEEDHAATLDFIRKCGFSQMHIFPYSRRPGTPADRMPEQIDRAVKTRRAKEAQSAAEMMHKKYLEKQIGNRLDVLFETEHDGICVGHSDNYLEVTVPGTALRGEIRPVLITGTDGDMLTGLLIN